MRFLQSVSDKKRSSSTLKVSVVTISALRVELDNQRVGSHCLVKWFLNGVLRLHPPYIQKIPPRDVHAFSVSQACMHWHVDGSQSALSLYFRQSGCLLFTSINLLSWLPSALQTYQVSLQDPLILLCSVKAYIKARTSLCKTDTIFVCYGETQARNACCCEKTLVKWILHYVGLKLCICCLSLLS